MSTPLASIVIITRNEAARIGACLEALLAQLDPDEAEVLVVDGASTDATVAIVEGFQERYRNVRVLRSHRWGYGFQRNLGVVHARGECVIFISGDAIPARTLMSHYRPHFGQGRICQGIIVIPHQHSLWSRSVSCAVQSLYIGGAEPDLACFSTVNVLIPRALLLAAPFEEGLPALEDKAWYLEARKSHPLMVVRAAVWHPIHEGLLGYCRKVFREGRALGMVRGRMPTKTLLSECNLFCWPFVGLVCWPLLVCALVLLAVTTSLWVGVALCGAAAMSILLRLPRRSLRTVLSPLMAALLSLAAGLGFALGYALSLVGQGGDGRTVTVAKS